MNQEKDAVKNVKRWMIEHRETLLAAGVTTIAGCYSGEGDEGTLQCVEFLDPLGERAKPFEENIVTELFEALHDELAPEGYENNEGGGGEFRLDIATGAIKHGVLAGYRKTTSQFIDGSMKAKARLPTSGTVRCVIMLPVSSRLSKCSGSRFETRPGPTSPCVTSPSSTSVRIWAAFHRFKTGFASCPFDLGCMVRN